MHGPGPSDVPEEVIRAMSVTTLGHLDPEFIKIMDETQGMLRALYQTKNRMTIPISGTGTSGMETLVANLVEAEDRVIVVRNGFFGERIAEIVSRYGGEVVPIDLEWGTVVTPDEVREVFSRKRCQGLFLVHAETSTGTLQQNMAEIGEIVHENGALFLVDTVTSLGGTEVKIDEWRIDAAYSGSQKCLSVPPGLSPVTFNEKAMEKVRGRKVPSFYFDLGIIEQYWNEGHQRKYHHTAPINMIYGLHEGLRLVLKEGVDARFQRHRRNAAALQAGLEALDFRYVVRNRDERLPMLHAVYLPDGAEEGRLRGEIRSSYNIEIGGGLGKFSGKAWRIGLMGYSSTGDEVYRLLNAIGEIFEKYDIADDRAVGSQAARAVYKDAENSC
ncbi:alanine--glyoxylate aminotransferase family protein [Candidatus Aerophobetes bacterium]|uniref:Alanine--glyoxylate aminotransferase family protein n=1 Tax=Aerophobetes bacterium TaxID=2030807 RepID=A0A523WD57_UNCAE|nr:MAG: alanine--glyoxylate aminotransferase family protein [Candidatus Aerophobetes bacterium]